MAQVSASQANRGPGPRETSGLWATGLATFAGIMMAVNGLFMIFYGIMAIAKDDVYVATPDYAFKFNVTSWGWIHLVVGAVVLAAGLGVLAGKTWARAVGIGVVSLALLGNFLSLPYYPLWSLVLLAFDVFIIWALATAE